MSNRNEPCFCGSGLKTKKCHSDIEPSSAFATVINLYNAVDAKIAQEAGNIRCKKGCFSCCHEHFNISAVEFYFIIYNLYKRDSLDKVRELTEKGYQFWANFEAKYPEDAEVLKRDVTGKSVSDRNTQRILAGISDDYKRISETPCMFLDDETKTCTIYDFRPFVCRTYGVGYTVKIEVPFSMCQYIPDGLDYQKEMADLTEFSLAENGLTAVLVKEINHVVIERSYPIFYFLKLQKDKIEVTLRKIDEYRSFSLSKVLGMKVRRMV